MTNRKGAGLVTAKYFGSGKYEVKAKLTRYPAGQDAGGGVVNAFWTFHYEEFSSTDSNYVCMPVGCHYRIRRGWSPYYARNHEIDIEIPGRDGPPLTGQSFKKGLFNYWRGENGDASGKHLAFS